MTNVMPKVEKGGSKVRLLETTKNEPRKYLPGINIPHTSATGYHHSSRVRYRYHGTRYDFNSFGTVPTFWGTFCLELVGKVIFAVLIAGINSKSKLTYWTDHDLDPDLPL